MLAASLSVSELAAVGGTLLVGVGLAAEVIRRSLDKLHRRIDDHMAREEEASAANRIEIGNLHAQVSEVSEQFAHLLGRLGEPMKDRP